MTSFLFGLPSPQTTGVSVSMTCNSPNSWAQWEIKSGTRVNILPCGYSTVTDVLTQGNKYIFTECNPTVLGSMCTSRNTLADMRADVGYVGETDYTWIATRMDYNSSIFTILLTILLVISGLDFVRRLTMFNRK